MTDSTINRFLFWLAWSLGLTFASSSAVAQTTTAKTDCVVNGNAANCTTTTTGNSDAYKSGQAVGDALGKGIAAGMQAHAFSKGLRKYCDAHPGEVWHYGNRSTGATISSGSCPTETDKAVAAANLFMAKHKDYIHEPANSELVTGYIDVHRLDPREEKSYERAYKDLKKSGQLRLYAK